MKERAEFQPLNIKSMPKTYYDPSDLKKFTKITELQPEMGDKFFDWYGSVFKEGALTAREKSLIALAVSHAVQCPYCIDAYTDACLKKGADEEQMMEAVHVAAAIKGGSVLVHGVQMMNQLKEKLM
ncbi:MAG: alkylhydroperoxidase/carboxymuconolactone decarboxylase family protein [Roseivirga sp.]